MRVLKTCEIIFHLEKSLGVRHMYLTPEYLADAEAKAQAADAEKALAAVRRILAASDEEIHSRSFVLEQVLAFGLSRQNWEFFQRWINYQNNGTFGLLQLPTEFTDFIMYVAQFKPQTALEVGVYAGATAYLSAAILQRHNPNLEYYMLDIGDQLVAFERFAELLNLRRLIPNTTADIAGREFDYVLIDADHSYSGAKSDYLAVGRYAKKIVAFHDIHGHEYDAHEGGIVRLWSEVRALAVDTHTVVEFAHCPTRWMGLGVIVK